MPRRPVTKRSSSELGMCKAWVPNAMGTFSTDVQGAFNGKDNPLRAAARELCKKGRGGGILESVSRGGVGLGPPEAARHAE